MIPEIDDALQALIRRDVVPGSGVEVAFDAPTKEWAARRSGPTVDVFLYDIREDLRRRERGLVNRYGPADGTAAPRIVARELPPRFFKLSYLVTAWTQRAEDEHRLLAALLSCLLLHETVPADLLAGPPAELGLPVPLTVALPPPEDRSFADVWSALGGELKPSLDVVVTVPTATGRLYPAAPPVTGGAVLQVGGVASTNPSSPAGERVWPAPETVSAVRLGSAPATGGTARSDAPGAGGRGPARRRRRTTGISQR